jgi:hypothetical protein
MTDFERLLRSLSEGGVEFIVVGGLAAVAHGGSRLTQDVDVVYSRAEANVERLVSALASFHPYLRGAPPGLPFEWSTATVQRGLNFTLTTTVGDIDLLGEITGGAATQEFFGAACHCLDLPWLVRVKRAAGRPKDLEAIAELEALLQERDGG